MQLLIGDWRGHNVKNTLLTNRIKQKRYTLLHTLGPEGPPASVEAG